MVFKYTLQFINLILGSNEQGMKSDEEKQVRNVAMQSPVDLPVCVFRTGEAHKLIHITHHKYSLD